MITIVYRLNGEEMSCTVDGSRYSDKIREIKEKGGKFVSSELD